ncbi:MAG: hypothetical protein JSU65_12800 [Candidatus Zixiibacteriota bacterium]|nr:MAG: hypothetical protein JSU65_12800 [candidate division Zixibacteria bacterium]
MMKRLMFMGVLIGGLAAMIIVAGCSDDSTTGPTDKVTGDPSDPELAFFMAGFESSDLYFDTLLVNMFTMIDSVQNDPQYPSSATRFSVPTTHASPPDSVVLTYHAESEFWYFYIGSVDTVFAGTDSQDVITFVIIDSVQFMHGDLAAQWPDSALLTGINQGARMTVTTESQAVGIEAEQAIALTGEIVEQGDVTINGSQSFTIGINLGEVSCEFATTLSSTFTDVQLNIAAFNGGACPTAGTASHAGAATITCTGENSGTFTDSWTVVQTFHVDYISYVVENSTTHWEFNEDCSRGVISAPGYRDLVEAYLIK